MQPLVFIDGDQGTTGLQIHERLRGRTDLVVIIAVVAVVFTLLLNAGPPTEWGR